MNKFIGISIIILSIFVGGLIGYNLNNDTSEDKLNCTETKVFITGYCDMDGNEISKYELTRVCR